MENQNNKANRIQQQHNKNKTQIQTIFNYLQNNVATATMVYQATGIAQKCITRHKRHLEKLGKLAEVKRQRCKITNCWAWYITTNVDLFSQSNQLKMF